IPYEIAVYTGNVFGAGTDAKVFITLYGEKGISPEKELDTKNSNDFERDHTDIYLLDFPFEGTLKKIKIRHDNSWFGSGWFLEKVVIKDPRGCMYTFPCHKWLAANYGDKKVARFIETRSVCEQDIKKKTK
ncbi:lipoxygenase homology domain-containing protein 1, partial [Exaiptasia diaphana]|uniref:PLAT domain-containing protein n=1 Tax=Exaiptasia diaphana TaxID=2652724 RepID=A0A913XLT6_EXADI